MLFFVVSNLNNFNRNYIVDTSVLLCVLNYRQKTKGIQHISISNMHMYNLDYFLILIS